MIRFLKKLFSQHQSNNKSFLQIIEVKDGNISFSLDFNTLEQAQKMMLEIVRIQHSKAFQIHQTIVDNSVIVKLYYSRSEKKGAHKLIEEILVIEKEVRDGEGN